MDERGKFWEFSFFSLACIFLYIHSSSPLINLSFTLLRMQSYESVLCDLFHGMNFYMIMVICKLFIDWRIFKGSFLVVMVFIKKNQKQVLFLLGF